MERLQRRLETFRNEPEEMIGAFERERASIDDYQGREILELLQNADDAGVDYGPNTALIRWWPEGMCVANTGVPFSTAGVDSLIVSNLSPKKLDRSRYIGNRGLGFRSVLAWSRCPFVLSGNLHLAFLPLLAAASLKQLTEESERVRQKVEERKGNGHETPIPILSCPAVIGSDKPPEFAKDERWRLMWERATELRTQYDTVVVLPFTEAGADERALKQIEGLNVELVLFLQYLKEIAIEAPGRRTLWRAERQRNSVTVTVEPNGSGVARWRIFPKRGLIPEDILTPGQRGTPAFEIRIAVREGATEPGFLYNYFPTNVRCPYPVVAHATMELTPNRQNLVETAPNRYLAAKLAESIAEVAEQSADPAHPWRALGLIGSRGMSADPVLEKLGFKDALLHAARSRKIVPKRDGAFALPGSVKRMPVPTEGWLPLEQFEDLVLSTEDYWLRNTLEWLQVEELSADEFRARVEKVSENLTLDERAALLAGIVRNRQCAFVPRDRPPILLVDRSGNPVDASAPAYLPPLSEAAFELPPWMAVRFVSGGLVEKMMEVLRYSRERLVEELREAGYVNIHEYDFRGLARAIIAQIGALCHEDPERADEKRLDGIRALRSLWSAAGGQNAPPRESALQVDIPTRSEEWKKAVELYLGAPYPKGALMEAILGKLHPALFVACPDAFGLGNDAEDWQDFLLWLGVAHLPRKETITCGPWKDREYLDHVQRAAKYPIEFDEFTVHSPEQMTLDSAQVTSIEHMHEILDHADPHAILAWVAVDDRLRTWRRQGDTDAQLTARFRSYTYRMSSHPVPSHVLWLLQGKAWLPTTTGGKRPPVECILAKTITDDLQRVFPRPAVNPKAEVFERLQIDQETLNQAIMSVGVRMSLEDVTWEQCYDLMLRLPEIDPEGKAATRVYRVIAEKSEDEQHGFALREREQEFKENGKLWSCTNGRWSYVPVAKGVYFPSDATIPKVVADDFPIIDLPRRRGLKKITDVFGVKVLRTQDIKIAIDQFDEVPRSDVLNDELQRLKPYVLAVRLDATPVVTGLAQFKRLRIIPCSRVTGRARVNERDIDISLANAGEALVVDDTAYLIVPPGGSIPFLQDVMVARHVANILAEVLDVERASDFAQLAFLKGHEVRKRVLSDILGHDAEGSVARARDSLQMEVEEELEPRPAWTPPTREPTEPQFTSAEKGPVSETGGMPTTVGGGEAPVPERVEAKAEERGPAGPKRTVEKREVTTRRSTREHLQQAHRVTDADRCEELAERFEESQGRFPLRVSTLQGTEGFGCDILSFSTREGRQQFIESEGKSIRLVQRFIEVKGRSLQKGTIPLEGNELEAARRYRERYYVYRVYEAVSGREWEVVELGNPLDYEWEMSYAVDPFRCPATKYWTVTGRKTDTYLRGN